jgi:hypothetical protein
VLFNDECTRLAAKVPGASALTGAQVMVTLQSRRYESNITRCKSLVLHSDIQAEWHVCVVSSRACRIEHTEMIL